MNETVRKFIEEQISYIDAGNWHKLFEMWYLHYADEERWKDGENLDALFRAFEAAGIALYDESEQIRENILHAYMYQYIDEVLTDDPDVKEITMPTVVNKLASKLDVRLTQLNVIFKTVAAEIALVHDVEIRPFRILR